MSNFIIKYLVDQRISKVQELNVSMLKHNRGMNDVILKLSGKRRIEGNKEDKVDYTKLDMLL